VIPLTDGRRRLWVGAANAADGLVLSWPGTPAMAISTHLQRTGRRTGRRTGQGHRQFSPLSQPFFAFHLLSTHTSTGHGIRDTPHRRSFQSNFISLLHTIVDPSSLTLRPPQTRTRPTSPLAITTSSPEQREPSHPYRRSTPVDLRPPSFPDL
jgi:hypothetical protein